MRAVVITFCLCLLAMSANAWDDTKYDTLEVLWPNGNLKEYVTRASHLGNEKGFLPHGIYRAYHENGQLAQEGHYIYNVKIGNWNYWDARGYRSSNSNYDNGKLTGLYFEWNSDQQFGVRGFYSNGLKTGLWIFRRSQPVDEFNNPHDLIDSVLFFQDGKLLVALEGFRGERLSKDPVQYNTELDLWVEWKRHNRTNILTCYEYFSIGKKFNGKKQGAWQIRNAGGELIRTEFYENGELKN